MADHQSSHTGRNETPLERADRNFIELLQELRVTQTGVQVLFAFLLSMAFTQRFESLDTFQLATYVTTLLLALLSAIIFVAPAALHRSLFQQNAKPLIVRVSDRLATVGMVVLMLAFTGSVTLVVDVALDRGAGIAAGAGTFLACTGLWGVLPRLVLRSGSRDDADETSAGAPETVSSSRGPREPIH
ncbi:DUF6328 family protein [Streptomyces sp. CRN 30]|uniref:DUF6328 family protein n=1 Tax=Streptomyces sp. CRN 30 TaxID=3075613 RepID=UPI002A82EFB3|nr:DUF6328 family protein [Streptomyces sp. CRN 30]